MRRGGALLAGLVLLAGCGGDDEDPLASDRPRSEPPARTSTSTATESGERSPQRLARSDGEPRVETWVRGLEVPWELAFLPDGRALVTERPGRVRIVSRGGRLRRAPAARVDVEAVGEGGLLGLALDPRFGSNRFVYLYRTAASGNEVLRYRLSGNRLTGAVTIVRGIAAGPIHDGGRIRFGPDGRLYIATGDAGQQDLAQQRGSLNGKILRLGPRSYRRRGGRPEIFSLGHRNSQGFDWQPRTNRLFETEHGPDGDDEVNLLRRGANYGWPQLRGGATREGFVAPIAVYPQSIAPSGATFVRLPRSEWTGDYLFGSLVGEQIRRLGFSGTRVTTNEALFQGEYGRVRTVVEGPDGALYALTNNRDGRGSPRSGDDRVLRIVPPAG